MDYCNFNHWNRLCRGFDCVPKKKELLRTDVETIIQTRRTIKPTEFRQNARVADEIIEKMLESAKWAPTHGKTEPWHFVVFSSEKSIHQLAQLDADIYEKLTKASKKYKVHKHKKRIETKMNSSHVIAICMKRQKAQEIPEHEEIIAVGMAVQNMHLVATKYNVGCFWSSGLTDQATISVGHAKEMKDFLQLEENDRCLGFFCIGISEQPWPKGVRKDIGEKVRWVEE